MREIAVSASMITSTMKANRKFMSWPATISGRSVNSHRYRWRITSWTGDADPPSSDARTSLHALCPSVEPLLKRNCIRDTMQKNDQLCTSAYILKPLNSGYRTRITPIRKIYTTAMQT